MSDARTLPLEGTAAVPRKNGEIVFEAPWQSRAFGLAVGLAERGLFHWDEFRERLIAEISEDRVDDESASPAAVYYRHWLSALERLLRDKEIISAIDLDARAAEFVSGERDEVF
jgi:nitrile hydratase accessory protein